MVEASTLSSRYNFFDGFFFVGGLLTSAGIRGSLTRVAALSPSTKN